MISVAICTCNGDRFLDDQLQSIVDNTPSEIILCDDNSTDNTPNVINHFREQSTMPIIYHQNNFPLGINKNFEKAILGCSGDIIFLSDQDDVWHSQKIEKIITYFQAHPEIGAIFTNAKIVDENLNYLGYDLWETVRFNDAQQARWREGKAIDILLKDNVVTGATLAFRSQFKDLILPIPESAFHDAWIALIIAFTGQIAFIDEPLIQYRQHDRNQIGSRRKTFVEKSQERLNDTIHQRLFLQFSELHQRLTQSSYRAVNSEQLYKLEQKIQHLQARADLPSHRRARLPVLFYELFSGRYHRYASGGLSFIRDLII